MYYIFGPSGSGKTRKAQELIKLNGYDGFDEVTHKNNFYLGVTGDYKACIYDEFRPNAETQYLKDLNFNKYFISSAYFLNNSNFILKYGYSPGFNTM